MSSETSETPGSDGPLEADDTETDGYVHNPESSSEASSEPYTGKAEGEGFGSQGWILVAGVVVCFLLIPGYIYLNPAAPAEIGWTFFMTFLVLPFIPALLLGLLAVWSMQAAA